MAKLELHNLKAPKGEANKTRRRVGRGNASGRGTYSTRGIKGQKARSGVSGLKLKGIRNRMLSIPKLRGFKSLQSKNAVINVGQLENAFDVNAVISPKSLAKKELIISPRYGVKILGDGKLTKSFTFRNVKVSASAKEKIEKAGGTIEAPQQA